VVNYGASEVTTSISYSSTLVLQLSTIR